MEGIERFLDGQRFGYETALAEMKQGEKRNHWIWYIFPQVKGLGHSPNAQYYGIKDLGLPPASGTGTASKRDNYGST